MPIIPVETNGAQLSTELALALSVYHRPRPAMTTVENTYGRFFLMIVQRRRT